MFQANFSPGAFLGNRKFVPLLAVGRLAISRWLFVCYLLDLEGLTGKTPNDVKLLDHGARIWIGSGFGSLGYLLTELSVVCVNRAIASQIRHSGISCCN